MKNILANYLTCLNLQGLKELADTELLAESANSELQVIFYLQFLNKKIWFLKENV